MVAGLYVIRPVLIFMRSKGDFHKRFAEGGADYQRTMALLVLRQNLYFQKEGERLISTISETQV